MTNKLEGKTALIVSADCPWPDNYSARIDVSDRISILSNLGIHVDLLATLGKHDCVINENALKSVRNVYIVQRRSGIFDMLGFLEPGQVWSRRRLAEINLTEKYDFLFLEGHYVSKVLENSTLKADFKILRINNDERVYFWMLSKSVSDFSKIYYVLEALRFCFSWRKLMNNVKVWLFSSYDDKVKMQQYSDSVGAHSVFFPPLVEINQSPSKYSNFGVIFIGTLLVPNNLEAIKWYLKFVHPLLLDLPGYHLTIAGRMTKDISVNKWLSGLSAVTIIPNPLSTQELYSKNAVFVNPMQNGAGIKLKTVHALAAGIPVVTTTIGAQGTCMRHELELYIADNPLQFANYIRKLLTDAKCKKSLVENAKQRLRLLYDQKVILEKLLFDLECSKYKSN